MKSCQVRIVVDVSDSFDVKKPELPAMNIVVPSGISLSEALVSRGFKIRHYCGGNGICGKCRGRVAIADTPMNNEEQNTETSDALIPDVSKQNRLEEDYATGNLSFREVLLCRTVVTSDMVVSLPASCFPDGEYVPIAFENVSIRHDMQDVKTRSFGIAVDLGTTTLVLSLLDLTTKTVLDRASCRNPQIATGADIITRIQYANRSPSHAQRMQKLVIDRIDEMIVALTCRYGVLPVNVESIVVAGNTVMTWFFCGLDTECLAVWPFQPPFKVVVPGVNAPVLNMPSCPHAKIDIMPVFAGFVGGDIVAGVLALENEKANVSGPILCLDLGTNGELALMVHDEIFVASTAAGPAFEGGGVRFGMTALPGAIEGVDYSGTPYWLRGEKSDSSLLVCNGKVPCGICGSGLVDAVAQMLRLGMIDRRGRFLEPECRQSAFAQNQPLVSSVCDRLGWFEGHKGFRLTDQAEDVWLTQGDIRVIQFAVGALRVGMRLLLRKASLAESDLKRVYLSGLFGSHLCLENARTIGLLPASMTGDLCVYFGNGALRGTEEYAFDPEKKALALEMVNKAHHIDLAAEKDFDQEYLDALVFPQPVSFTG